MSRGRLSYTTSWDTIQILLSRFRCPRFRLPGFAWLDFSHVQTAIILVCARAIKNKKAASFVIS